MTGQDTLICGVVLAQASGLITVRWSRPLYVGRALGVFCADYTCNMLLTVISPAPVFFWGLSGISYHGLFQHGQTCGAHAYSRWLKHGSLPRLLLGFFNVVKLVVRALIRGGRAVGRLLPRFAVGPFSTGRLNEFNQAAHTQSVGAALTTNAWLFV